MKDAFDGQVDIRQLWNRQFHQWQKDSLDRLPHVRVFLRRLTYDCGRINRIFAMRHASDVKDGIEILQRVKSGVVTERALGTKFVKIYVTFDYDLAGCRDFEIDRFTLHEIHGCTAKESGNQILLDLWWRGDDCRESDGGIGADGYGDLHFSGRAVAFRNH